MRASITYRHANQPIGDDELAATFCTVMTDDAGLEAKVETLARQSALKARPPSDEHR
jgi:hypothetical protein